MRKNSFLYNIAADVQQNFGSDTKNLVVVFPSRRSGRVFQRHLAEMSQNPIWSPQITTIDDFFRDNSELSLADPITQLSVLHNVWNKIYQFEQAEPFQQFYFFGKILIRDFDLIDKYLIRAEKIYGQLKELKEIDLSFQPDFEDQEALLQLIQYLASDHREGSPGQKFMKVWKGLSSLYTSYRKTLHEKGLAYSGMIYRDVAEKLETVAFSEKHTFIFAGFNRINRCEHKLFSHLQQKGKAIFYWNEDPYLLKELKKEGGKFLTENLKSFPPRIKTSTDLKNDQKQLQIIPLPFRSLQTQAIVSLMMEKTEEQTSGVVLSDEEMLLPLLWSLPENRPPINVSAGIKLSGSPPYDLMRDLICLYEEAEKNKGEFHYSQLEKIFFNPCFPNLNKLWLQAVKIRTNGKLIDLRTEVFLSPASLTTILSHPVIQEIVQIPSGSSELLQKLLRILELGYELNAEATALIEEENISLMQEIIRSAHQMLIRLRDILSAWPEHPDFQLLKNMLRDLAQSRRIPFKGEPLSGIQLMGALESRNVSYDQLILPSLNEGIQPTNPGQTLIPFTLKKYFGLPTAEDEMADQSYYFWTMLAGAKSIFMLYDSASGGGLKKAEPSRFIQQIKYGDFKNWDYKEETHLSLPLGNNQPNPITVKRSPEIQQQLLDQLKARGLSPTSFLHFLKCELRFYFQFVLGADTEDQISEEVDARIMGSILHDLMEELYKPYNGKMVEASDVLKFKLEYHTILRRKLDKYRKTTDKKLAGHDVAAMNYMGQIAENILDFDLKDTPFIMNEHEKKLEFIKNIKGNEVRFTAKVDRIHLKDDNYIVVDYKTGGDRTEFSLQNIMPLPGNDQDKASNLNSAAIQLLMYCWMLQQSDIELSNHVLHPSIYATRKLNKDFHPELVVKEGKNEAKINTQTEEYQNFILQFEKTLETLLNPNRPFEQTKDEKTCTFCSFKNICMRKGETFFN